MCLLLAGRAFPSSSSSSLGGRARPRVKRGSELRVGSQAVELLRRVLLHSAAGRPAEAGRDLVKRPTLGLRHFEEGEDEEQEQQHGEDDEHVGAAQLLRERREERGERRDESSMNLTN